MNFVKYVLILFLVLLSCRKAPSRSTKNLIAFDSALSIYTVNASNYHTKALSSPSFLFPNRGSGQRLFQHDILPPVSLLERRSGSNTIPYLKIAPLKLRFHHLSP
jgi:hypothetical protein